MTQFWSELRWTKVGTLKRWRSFGAICGKPKLAYYSQAMTQFWSELRSSKARILKRRHTLGAIFSQQKCAYSSADAVWSDFQSTKAHILIRWCNLRLISAQVEWIWVMRFEAGFNLHVLPTIWGCWVWLLWKQYFTKSLCFGWFEDNIMELFHEKVHDFVDLRTIIMELFHKKVHDFVDLMTIPSNFFIKMFMFRLFWGQLYAAFSWKSSRFRWFEDNYHNFITFSWNCLRFGRFEGNIMWFFLKKSIIKLFRALWGQYHATWGQYHATFS